MKYECRFNVEFFSSRLQVYKCSLSVCFSLFSLSSEWHFNVCFSRPPHPASDFFDHLNFFFSFSFPFFLCLSHSLTHPSLFLSNCSNFLFTIVHKFHSHSSLHCSFAFYLSSYSVVCARLPFMYPLTGLHIFFPHPSIYFSFLKMKYVLVQIPAVKCT